jgi:hypothetical protein
VRLGLDATDSAETIVARRSRPVDIPLPEARYRLALPEKRKVDSSILSLTTSFGLVSSALTSPNAYRAFLARVRRATMTAHA